MTLYNIKYYLGPLTDEERNLPDFVIADNYQEAFNKVFNKVKNPKIVVEIKVQIENFQVLN